MSFKRYWECYILVWTLTHFMTLALTITPENIRKTKVFWCFQGVSKEASGMNGLTTSFFFFFVKKMQIEIFILGQFFTKCLFWFYFVLFIATNISTRFFFPNDKGISTCFLYASLFSAHALVDFSSWMDRNWDWRKTFPLVKAGGKFLWEGIFYGERDHNNAMASYKLHVIKYFNVIPMQLIREKRR